MVNFLSKSFFCSYPSPKQHSNALEVFTLKTLDFILDEQFCTEDETLRARSFRDLLERAHAAAVSSQPVSTDGDEDFW